MITWKSALRLYACSALLVASLLADLPVATAQDTDTEPNNPCPQAQNLGAIQLPFSLTGNLASTSAGGDVDFFRFIGTPGALVRIDLEGAPTSQGTLDDPYLGAFDSSCNLILANDDFQSLNSRITIAIPPDGVLIVGATRCCDGTFLNGGNGTYRLSISAFAAIRSISGRTVDAVTHEVLPGSSAPPFSSVRLLRCEAGTCLDVLPPQPVGSDGRFQFSRDLSGQLLPAGSYQVIATANEYQAEQTDPVEVFEGEDRDLGDIALEPFPVRFSDITPCADVPVEGGRCRYSVRVTNRLGTKLTGAAWSLVEAIGTGSLSDSTRFQSNGARKFSIHSLESKIVHFDFDVPGTVRAGASICTSVFFADDKREPFFNTVGQSPLFCITKSAGPSPALSVVPNKDAQKMFRGSDSRMIAPPKVKSH